MKTKTTLEVTEKFNYQKLTPAEQQSRGILGRLQGVIADTINPTRNGRKYSGQLWENVFNNPIMQEKIRNRCVYGELGHPEDRSEIDMEKIAVCLAELPKKGTDGKLYGVLDILDTPNGRILKTLCDYGSVVGVSSRGQGDLITDNNGDEAVDPDTYECECFDIVLVPAVESARMQYMKEGLDSSKLKLRKALCESFNSASEEDKKVMKETLKELNINIDESLEDKKAELDKIKAEADKVEASIKAEGEKELAKLEADKAEVEAKIAEVKETIGEEPVAENVEVTEAKDENSGEEVSSEDVTSDDVTETPEEVEATADDIDVMTMEEPTDVPADNMPVDDVDLETIDTEDVSVEEPTEEEPVNIDELTDEQKEQIFLDFLASHFEEDKVKEACDVLDIEVEEEDNTEDAESEDDTEEEPEESSDDAEESEEAEEEKPADDEDAEEVEEDINITNNNSPSRVDNRAKETEAPVEEGLGLLGIGDVNVNVDASGTNAAVGVGGGKGTNEGLIPEIPGMSDLPAPKLPGLGEEKECNGESCADKKSEAKEAIKESVEAIDDGDAALIRSLQEALKGKSDLENNLKSLQEQLAVSDTKVNGLTEECNKYKEAIARLSTISKSTKDLKESISTLEKQNSEKDAIIEEQKTRIARLVKSRKESVAESLSLNESVSTSKAKVAELNESLNKANDEIKVLNQQKETSDKEVTSLKESLTKATTLKESYKNLAEKAVNKYIDVKARMLGLTSSDIKRKLGESYTLTDVDNVCESLKSYQLNVSKLPISIDRQVGIRVNESKTTITGKTSNAFDDDEVSDSLISLANKYIKK